MPHDHIHPVDIQKSGRLEKSAVFLSIGLSIIMIGLKIYGWMVTDSLSILSSLTDSLMDVLVSGINLFAIYYALKPADDDHRFGHTAIEDLAGLFQASMLAGTSLLILIESLDRFIHPLREIENLDIGMNIMLISLLLTFVLVLYQQFVIRKSKSVVVESDSLHYLSDLLTTGGVLLSLYLWNKFSWGWIDPLLAIIIVSIIFAGAYKIGIRSFHNLMDRELEDDKKQLIIDLLKQEKDNDKIKGYHALRTRRSGRKVFVQMHLDLDRTLSLYDAHEIAESIELQISNLFTDADVIIHEDPV